MQWLQDPNQSNVDNLNFKSLAVSLRTTRFDVQIPTWCLLCLKCFIRIS